MKYKITLNLEDRYKYQLKITILKWLKINIFGIISVLLMSIIFSFSSQNGIESYHLSKSIEAICKSVFGLSSIVHIFNIRKIAHFILFALLGSCIFTHIRYKYYFYHKYLYYLYALGFTTIYACLDECHQLFVFGRGASVIDIMIDMFGCSIALLINFIVICLLEKRNMKIKQKYSNIYKN